MEQREIDKMRELAYRQEAERQKAIHAQMRTFGWHLQPTNKSGVENVTDK